MWPGAYPLIILLYSQQRSIIPLCLFSSPSLLPENSRFCGGDRMTRFRRLNATSDESISLLLHINSLHFTLQPHISRYHFIKLTAYVGGVPISNLANLTISDEQAVDVKSEASGTYSIDTTKDIDSKGFSPSKEA